MAKNETEVKSGYKIIVNNLIDILLTHTIDSKERVFTFYIEDKNKKPIISAMFIGHKNKNNKYEIDNEQQLLEMFSKIFPNKDKSIENNIYKAIVKIIEQPNISDKERKNIFNTIKQKIKDHIKSLNCNFDLSSNSIIAYNTKKIIFICESNEIKDYEVYTSNNSTLGINTLSTPNIIRLNSGISPTNT